MPKRSGIGRKSKGTKKKTKGEVKVSERNESLRSSASDAATLSTGSASDALTISIQPPSFPPPLDAQELLNECLHDRDPLLESTQISKRHAIGYMISFI